MLVRQGDKAAFVLRAQTKWMNGYYGLPSGKVEKGEAFTAAAVREAREEIGIRVKPADLKPLLTVHRYEPSSFAPDWVDVYFEASRWSGTPRNAEAHRHSELAWLDLNTLPDNIVPAVRFGLKLIQEGTSYGEYGWSQ